MRHPNSFNIFKTIMAAPQQMFIHSEIVTQFCIDWHIRRAFEYAFMEKFIHE